MIDATAGLGSRGIHRASTIGVLLKLVWHRRVPIRRAPEIWGETHVEVGPGRSLVRTAGGCQSRRVARCGDGRGTTACARRPQKEAATGRPAGPEGATTAASEGATTAAAQGCRNCSAAAGSRAGAGEAGTCGDAAAAEIHCPTAAAQTRNRAAAPAESGRHRAAAETSSPAAAAKASGACQDDRHAAAAGAEARNTRADPRQADAATPGAGQNVSAACGDCRPRDSADARNTAEEWSSCSHGEAGFAWACARAADAR